MYNQRWRYLHQYFVQKNPIFNAFKKIEIMFSILIIYLLNTKNQILYTYLFLAQQYRTRDSQMPEHV